MASPLAAITGAEVPAQDYITLGGMQSPGRATITNLVLERKLDVRQGYGSSGGEVVYTGDKPAKFDVQIDLWLPEHFALWERFAKICLAKPKFGVQGMALDIDHPLLKIEPLKITSVCVEKVSQFEQDDEGMWTCTISFVQWLKPRPAISKTVASIPNAVTKVPTAQDAADLEIQRLMKELSGLAAK